MSHKAIIDEGGGPAAVARSISEIEEKHGRAPVDANTTKAWKRSDSIPNAYWFAFSEAGLASLERLAQAAAARRPAAPEAVQA